MHAVEPRQSICKAAKQRILLPKRVPSTPPLLARPAAAPQDREDNPSPPAASTSPEAGGVAARQLLHRREEGGCGDTTRSRQSAAAGQQRCAAAESRVNCLAGELGPACSKAGPSCSSQALTGTIGNIRHPPLLTLHGHMAVNIMPGFGSTPTTQSTHTAVDVELVGGGQHRAQLEEVEEGCREAAASRYK